MLLTILLGAAFVAGMGALTSLRVLREYERAIVFRWGRARQKALGPGMVLMLPFGIDRATVVDTRTKVVQIPPQDELLRPFVVHNPGEQITLVERVGAESVTRSVAAVHAALAAGTAYLRGSARQ